MFYMTQPFSGSETHFKVVVVSNIFDTLSPVQVHAQSTKMV